MNCAVCTQPISTLHGRSWFHINPLPAGSSVHDPRPVS